jgi:hypothetical protein
MALTKNLAILGHKRYAQGGTVTASSEQVSYPAANLAGTRLWGPVWRSVEGELEDVLVQVDLGAAKECQGLSLVGCNFSLDATREVIASNNADLSSPLLSVAEGDAFDTSLATLDDDRPPWGLPLIYLHSAPITARYWAFRISDPNNVRGYLRAAIMLAEPIWQPVRNFSVNWERGGKLEGDEGVEQFLRELQIPLHRLTPAEERQIVSLTRTLKSTGRLLWVPEPLSPETWLQDAIWGKLNGTVKITNVDKGKRFRSLALNVEEVSE